MKQGRLSLRLFHFVVCLSFIHYLNDNTSTHFLRTVLFFFPFFFSRPANRTNIHTQTPKNTRTTAHLLQRPLWLSRTPLQEAAAGVSAEERQRWWRSKDYRPQPCAWWGSQELRWRSGHFTNTHTRVCLLALLLCFFHLSTTAWVWPSFQTLSFSLRFLPKSPFPRRPRMKFHTHRKLLSLSWLHTVLYSCCRFME